jgi:UDP-GlcNAc:undecaprenyl-phosphate GlcNAc-1-phosphate transferase
MNIYLFLIFFIFLNLILFISYNKIKSIITVKDYPDDRKIHKKPVPLLGGPILFFNLSIFIFLINLKIINFNFNININLFYLYCLIIFVLGLLDDIYIVNPNKKLFAFFILFFSYCFFEKSILIQNISFSFRLTEISIGQYSYLFTVICFIAFINAFNMFDGINLQTSTYSIFLSLNIVFFNFNLLFLMILIFLIFFSFLNYNNKSFLGNSGSYLLPFIFSITFILNHNFYDFNADLIFVLMAIPGFELIRLTIYRIYKGKHPFFPDKNHIHHLMLKKFSYYKTIIFTNSLIFSQLIIYKVFSKTLISIFIGMLIYINVIYLISKNKK